MTYVGGFRIGFVLAFSLFSFFSRVLILSTGVDLDLIKNGSLILLAAFGLVLLSEKLSEKFSMGTQRLASFGDKFSNRQNTGGFWSGVTLGVLIGFIWTPCAGPILAAVLVQIIQQKSNAEGLLLIACFSLGVAIPMGIISLMGREVMDRLLFVKQHSSDIRKGLGVIIIASVVINALGNPFAYLTSLTSKMSAKELGSAKGLVHPVEKPYPAPHFSGIGHWFNTPALTMDQLKGKVVLIDFWTYSCVNCIRTLPYLVGWDKQYRDQGLVIVGVHAPEFEFEKKLDNIQAALGRFGILYPVAVDNGLSTWSNFNNQYWPAHYLIDRSGQVVYTHFGEGDYDVTEHNIQYLLGIPFQSSSKPTEASPPMISFQLTPETYLGSARSERFSGNIPKETADLSATANFLAVDHWQLNDQWEIKPQFIRSTSNMAKLRLHFSASKVFLVLGHSGDTPMTLHVKLNGKVATDQQLGKDAPGGIITVQEHRLYEILDLKNPGTGVLELEAQAPGIEAYAFTFG